MVLVLRGLTTTLTRTVAGGGVSDSQQLRGGRGGEDGAEMPQQRNWGFADDELGMLSKMRYRIRRRWNTRRRISHFRQGIVTGLPGLKDACAIRW